MTAVTRHVRVQLNDAGRSGVATTSGWAGRRYQKYPLAVSSRGSSSGVWYRVGSKLIVEKNRENFERRESPVANATAFFGYACRVSCGAPPSTCRPCSASSALKLLPKFDARPPMRDNRETGRTDDASSKEGGAGRRQRESRRSRFEQGPHL